jgi:hypothetical protein
MTKEDRLRLLKDSSDLFSVDKMTSSTIVKLRKILDGNPKIRERLEKNELTKENVELAFVILSPIFAELIVENNSKFLDVICSLLTLDWKN